MRYCKNPVQFSRREALLAFSGSVLFPGLVSAQNADSSTNVFISASAVDGDRHQVRGFVLTGEQVDILFGYDLPGRGHHVAVNPGTGEYIAVARRPGTWLAVGSYLNPAPPRIIEVPEGSHLCGHGVFSGDGNTFYTVETEDADQGDNGRIGVWSLNFGEGLVRKTSLPTYGVGPHEIKFMPDGRTLVVANGGIRSAFDDDRTKLNVESMQPSLVYMDAISGKLNQQVMLDSDMHQNSIRHLDINADGQVAIAMQFEGEPFRNVPLVGLHKSGDEKISLPEIPLFEQQQLNQYCGSVRFDESGQFLAVSSPRGNRITFWDVQGNRFLNAVRSRDGCGVCALGNGFVFTSGTGRIAFYNLETGAVTNTGEELDQHFAWDNHLSRA